MHGMTRYIYAWHDLSIVILVSFLFFSFLRKPRALDFTIGAWQQRAFELNYRTTASVPTVINCRAILASFIGNSPGLPYPFIGIFLSFGSSAQSQGNPTSSGHLTPFIGRPYILNLFMLVRLPGV